MNTGLCVDVVGKGEAVKPNVFSPVSIQHGITKQGVVTAMVLSPGKDIVLKTGKFLVPDKLNANKRSILAAVRGLQRFSDGWEVSEHETGHNIITDSGLKTDSWVNQQLWYSTDSSPPLLSQVVSKGKVGTDNTAAAAGDTALVVPVGIEKSFFNAYPIFKTTSILNDTTVTNIIWTVDDGDVPATTLWEFGLKITAGTYSGDLYSRYVFASGKTVAAGQAFMVVYELQHDREP